MRLLINLGLMQYWGKRSFFLDIFEKLEFKIKMDYGQRN